MPLNEESRWDQGAKILMKNLVAMEKAGTIQSSGEKCGALLLALVRTAARKAKDEEQSLAQFEQNIAETNKMFMDMSRVEFRRLWGDIK